MQRGGVEQVIAVLERDIDAPHKLTRERVKALKADLKAATLLVADAEAFWRCIKWYLAHRDAEIRSIGARMITAAVAKDLRPFNHLRPDMIDRVCRLDVDHRVVLRCLHALTANGSDLSVCANTICMFIHDAASITNRIVDLIGFFSAIVDRSWELLPANNDLIIELCTRCVIDMGEEVESSSEAVDAYIPVLLKLQHANRLTVAHVPHVIYLLCAAVNFNNDAWGLLQAMLNSHHQFACIDSLILTLEQATGTQPIDENENLLGYLRRGAVFFTSNALWGAGRVEKANVYWCSALQPMRYAARDRDLAVITETVLSLQRLVSGFGESLSAEWVYILQLIEDLRMSIETSTHLPNTRLVQLDEAVNVDPTTLCVSRAYKDLRATILHIHELVTKDAYLGPQDPYYAILERFFAVLPPNVLLHMLEFQKQFAKPYEKGWSTCANKIIQNFLFRTDALEVRLKAIEVVYELAISTSLVPDAFTEFVDHVLLPNFSAIHDDKAPRVRTEGLDLLKRVYERFRGPHCEKLLHKLQNAVLHSQYQESRMFALQTLCKMLDSMCDSMPPRHVMTSIQTVVGVLRPEMSAPWVLRVEAMRFLARVSANEQYQVRIQLEPTEAGTEVQSSALVRKTCRRLFCCAHAADREGSVVLEMKDIYAVLESVLSEELIRVQKHRLGLADHSILRYMTDCVRAHVLNYHILHCVSLTSFMQKLCCLMIGLSNPPPEPQEQHSKSLLEFAKGRFHSSGKADLIDRHPDQQTRDSASTSSPSSNGASPTFRDGGPFDLLDAHLRPGSMIDGARSTSGSLQQIDQSGHSTADTFTLGYLFEFCSIMASYLPGHDLTDAQLLVLYLSTADNRTGAEAPMLGSPNPYEGSKRFLDFPKFTLGASQASSKQRFATAFDPTDRPLALTGILNLLLAQPTRAALHSMELLEVLQLCMTHMQDLAPQNQAIIVSRVAIALFLLIGLPSHSFIDTSAWEQVVTTLSMAARNLGSGDYSYIGTVCVLRALDRLVRIVPQLPAAEGVARRIETSKFEVAHAGARVTTAELQRMARCGVEPWSETRQSRRTWDQFDAAASRHWMQGTALFSVKIGKDQHAGWALVCRRNVVSNTYWWVSLQTRRKFAREDVISEIQPIREDDAPPTDFPWASTEPAQRESAQATNRNKAATPTEKQSASPAKSMSPRSEQLVPVADSSSGAATTPSSNSQVTAAAVAARSVSPVPEADHPADSDVLPTKSAPASDSTAAEIADEATDRSADGDAAASAPEETPPAPGSADEAMGESPILDSLTGYLASASPPALFSPESVPDGPSARFLRMYRLRRGRTSSFGDDNIRQDSSELSQGPSSAGLVSSSLGAPSGMPALRIAPPSDDDSTPRIRVEQRPRSLTDIEADPIARVRATAVRALSPLTPTRHSMAIRALGRDHTPVSPLLLLEEPSSRLVATLSGDHLDGELIPSNRNSDDEDDDDEGDGDGDDDDGDETGGRGPEDNENELPHLEGLPEPAEQRVTPPAEQTSASKSPSPRPTPRPSPLEATPRRKLEATPVSAAPAPASSSPKPLQSQQSQQSQQPHQSQQPRQPSTTTSEAPPPPAPKTTSPTIVIPRRADLEEMEITITEVQTPVSEVPSDPRNESDAAARSTSGTPRSSDDAASSTGELADPTLLAFFEDVELANAFRDLGYTNLEELAWLTEEEDGLEEVIGALESLRMPLAKRQRARKLLRQRHRIRELLTEDEEQESPDASTPMSSLSSAVKPGKDRTASVDLRIDPDSQPRLAQSTSRDGITPTSMTSPLASELAPVTLRTVQSEPPPRIDYMASSPSRLRMNVNALSIEMDEETVEAALNSVLQLFDFASEPAPAAAAPSLLRSKSPRGRASMVDDGGPRTPRSPRALRRSRTSRTSMQLDKLNPALNRAAMVLDGTPIRETHKLALMFVARHAEDEAAILRPHGINEDFADFLLALGKIVPVSTLSDYNAGLDPTEEVLNGEFALVYEEESAVMVFHLPLLMSAGSSDEHLPVQSPQPPHKPSALNPPAKNGQPIPAAVRGGQPALSKQLVDQKKHIGNDFVHILFHEVPLSSPSDSPISGAFGLVVIHIQRVLADNLFRLSVITKNGAPEELKNFLRMELFVAKDNLARAVRELATICDTACRCIVDSKLGVGFASNWLERQRLLADTRSRFSLDT